MTYHNLKCLPDADGKIYLTKENHTYRLGNFRDGAKAILFPRINKKERYIQWMPPTEHIIFQLNDKEIIKRYKEIDSWNCKTKSQRNKLAWELLQEAQF